MHARPVEKSLQSTAARIVDLIFELGNANLPLKSAQTRARLEALCEAYVSQGEPVRMVLPAFPAKSANPEKTSGSLPDLGEVIALKRLEALCTRIETIHPPGARITICSDGRVFSDLVGVSDEDVDAYGEGVREIIERFGLTRLDTFDLEQVFPQSSYDGMRTALVDGFAAPLGEVRRCDRALFNGIHRFLFEDRIAKDPHRSRNKARTETKEAAYLVIQRSNAWSRLVESHFPGALRLSIHPQDLDSMKIGIQMLPTRGQWRTPWHGAIITDGRRIRLTTRALAEAAGAQRAQALGRYAYFRVADLAAVEDRV